MLINGFILGTMTLCGFWIIYTKMPARFKAFFLKHPLLTEICTLLGTYALHISFGSGATVLLSAAICSIETSMLITIANDPELCEAAKAGIARITAAKAAAVASLKNFLCSKKA